jgi:hypothetical protein
LPVVLYGCENWSVTLRKEHRLKELRRVFEPNRSELTGDWRRLHYEKNYDLYSSLNLIRVIK